MARLSNKKLKQISKSYLNKMAIDTFELLKQIDEEEYNTYNTFKNPLSDWTRVGKTTLKLNDIKVQNQKVISANRKGLDITTFYIKEKNYNIYYYFLKVSVTNIAKLLKTDAPPTTKLYTEKDKQKIKVTLNEILNINNFGNIDDFKIKRIDYAINIDYTSENIKNCVLNLLHQTKSSHTKNKRAHYTDSLYEGNKSMTYNLYDKVNQLIKKNGVAKHLIENNKGLIRYEVQIKKTNTIIKKEFAKFRTFDDLFNTEVAKNVFNQRMKNLLKSEYNYYDAKSILEKYKMTFGSEPKQKFQDEVIDAGKPKPKLKLSQSTLKILKTLEVNPCIIKNEYRIKTVENVLNVIK